jgi:hypothetical protein
MFEISIHEAALEMIKLRSFHEEGQAYISDEPTG